MCKNRFNACSTPAIMQLNVLLIESSCEDWQLEKGEQWLITATLSRAKEIIQCRFSYVFLNCYVMCSSAAFKFGTKKNKSRTF